MADQTGSFSGKAGLRHVPNVFASRRPGVSGWDGKRLNFKAADAGAPKRRHDLRTAFIP